MNRPASVTVFGILNILFVVIGLIALSITWQMLSVDPGKPVENPAYQPLVDHPALLTYMRIAAGLGFVASMALAVGAVGLLKMRPWGRTLTLGYAAFSVVANLVGAAVNLAVYVPALFAQADAEKDAIKRGAMLGGAIGGAVGGIVIGVGYPILLLWFLRRPSVAQAFREEAAGGPPPVPA